MASLGAVGTASPGNITGNIGAGGAIMGAEGGTTGSNANITETIGYTGHIPTAAINFLPEDWNVGIIGMLGNTQAYADNSGVISGTIRRNGVNQADVHVALLNEITGYRLHKTITDANGNFSFPGLYEGQPIYTIVAWGDDYTLGLTQSNLTPTTNFILDYLDSGGSTRVQTKVLTDVAGRVRETTISSYLSYTTTIGDGSSTSFLLTHNLDTRDLIIQVRRAASPYDLVDVAVEYTSVNTVTLVFASPPAVNDFRVIILG